MKTTKYGQFSADGTEFILTEPLLSRPWMNILTNGNWCFVASHVGGGYSYVGQPSVGRITRWHVDGVPRDTVGKFIFLRDEETGQWWNANGYPPTQKLQSWRCHIGLGYNKIISENLGIASEITYFTPMPDASKAGTFEVGDACLIWNVKLTNTSDRSRRISSTCYAELAPGNWFEDTSWREFYTLMQRQQYVDNTIWHRATTWVKETDGWQAQDSDANNSEFPYSIFLNCSEPAGSFTGDRYAFVGPYRDLTRPAAMESPTLDNKVAIGRDACFSMQNSFVIAPGQSVEYVLVLGAEKTGCKSSSRMCEKYNTPQKARLAFDNLKKYWGNIISSPWVETPDHDLNMLINIWFKYQGAILSWWNRNTGYCYSGIYDFGIRDACQDAVSRLPHHPDWVRDFIKNKIMIWQFDGGDYAHSGNFMNMHAARTFHSDDPLNPLYIIASYCNETNDFSILHEKTAWVDPVTCISGKSQKQPSPIYEHAVVGVDWFWRMFSERGLPLILKGDWNDALNQCGQAPKIDSQGRVLEDQKLCSESVLLAGWAVMCIEMFYPCMEYMKDFQRLEKYKKRIEELKAKVNELCWDGSWYWRASDKTGRIIGTRRQLKQGGAIWSNPNAFAIITGIADQARTAEILNSFDTYLDTPYGSLLFYPPFYEPDENAGIISRFAPGTKENGSVFCHASRWRIWAECVAGRGDKAYEILRQTLPTTLHQSMPDKYLIEPYVACQFIYAPESDNPGEGSHSWATGTACWTLVNVFEHMLGIKPETAGLRIDPCLPKNWESVKVVRKFRGDIFEILIKKERGICKGKVTIELDGNILDDNIIIGRGDGSRHEIVVTISSDLRTATKQGKLQEQTI